LSHWLHRRIVCWARRCGAACCPWRLYVTACVLVRGIVCECGNHCCCCNTVTAAIHGLQCFWSMVAATFFASPSVIILFGTTHGSVFFTTFRLAIFVRLAHNGSLACLCFVQPSVAASPVAARHCGACGCGIGSAAIGFLFGRRGACRVCEFRKVKAKACSTHVATPTDSFTGSIASCHSGDTAALIVTRVHCGCCSFAIFRAL